MRRLLDQEWEQGQAALNAFAGGKTLLFLQGNTQAHFDQRWTALALALADGAVFNSLLNALPQMSAG